LTQRRSSPAIFIAGPVLDRIGIIYAPLLALLLGIIIYASPLRYQQIQIGTHQDRTSNLFILCFIYAHLFLVFFRSHGNPAIFRQYPVRFVAAPILLFLSMLSSNWIAASVAVLAVSWDVYHSCMQTFGIGRIYDARAGNDPNIGRQLDQGLNLLLYAGPILAGTSLMLHVQLVTPHSGEPHSDQSLFFSAVPAFAMQYQRVLTRLILCVGIPYLAWYVFSYWRLRRSGYCVSFEKVALLVSTGCCSIYTWGFNSFGQAFFIMNFFHALQYFVIVWKTEGTNLQGRMGLGGKSWGRLPTLLGFLGIATAFGVWGGLISKQNDASPEQYDVSFCIITVVAIMHFWYDGFIWSVRKKEV